ncbi:hypothetical protein C3L33_00930, partial [Rhododendron williamsianum]
MAAKCLYPWADDKPHLKKQIGCMTGIFQLLDRQHVLTGRRTSGQSPKRLPSGNPLTGSSASLAPWFPILVVPTSTMALLRKRTYAIGQQ